MIYSVLLLAELATLSLALFIILRQRKSLYRSQEILEILTNTSGFGVLLFDADGSYLYSNTLSKRFLSLLIGNNKPKLSDVLNHFYDHAVEVDQGLELVLSRSELLDDFEQFREVVKSDGGGMYLVEMHRTYTQKTKILLKDIEWIKAQQEQVLQLSKTYQEVDSAIGLTQRDAEIFKAQKLDALGRLSAGIAHDFNNILSIIDGYAGMVVKNLDQPEKVAAFIDKVRSASKRGAGLTRQMLTFSSHRIVAEGTIDIAKIMDEQKSLIDPMIDGGIDFSMRCEVEKAYAECSADSLAQILLNLCINARDAMPPHGGEIHVVLEECSPDDLPPSIQGIDREKDFLCLSVSDTGIGMEKEVQEKIFDPFYTTKEQGKGTGLGLSVVYGLVQEMSGYIHVYSQLSHGSTFYVYIPKSDQEPLRALSGNIDDADSISLQGYSILVVEDEADLRSIIVETLEDRGMRVLSAESGEEALVLQDEHVGEIDVMLTDVVMPGISGLKLAELMQALHEDLPVIYMSGYPANGEMAQVDLPDDAYFIAKPVNYDVLCQLIFACLSGSEDGGAASIASMTAEHWETQNVAS